jgi:hypothetical protein
MPWEPEPFENESHGTLTLGQVDPAIASEVIRDITGVIEAAAKSRQ